MRRLPLRVRLVAGFVVAMLVLLIAAGVFVYWRVEYALDRGLDTELAQATTTLRPLVGTTGEVSSRESADATGVGWQVVDRTGHVVDFGGPAPNRPLVSRSALARASHGAVTSNVGSLLPIADKPYRVRISPVGHSSLLLLVAVRRDHRDEALRELLVQLSVAGLGALAVAAVIGDLLARAALRPVERYHRRAADIARGATGVRLDVPPERNDEVTRLGDTLNEMLAALEQSLERERRFVDDASHELRTPLTLLKSRIQLALRRTRSPQEYQRVLDELAVDVARLTDLAEQLLEIRPTEPRPDSRADVAEIVTAISARLDLARPDPAGWLAVDPAVGSSVAAVDPAVVERVLTNLIDNAVKHGRSPVRLHVATVEGQPTSSDSGIEPPWVLLTVQDAGDGMPPDLLETATGRFTRSADARARPGAGLGLSLVEQMVAGAGAELRLCYAGHHVSRGTPTRAPCGHDEAMTVSVFLPCPPSFARWPRSS